MLLILSTCKSMFEPYSVETYSCFLIRYSSIPCYFRLLSCVTEHLTAEIVQLTVSDITRVIEWMKCSYLFVRMKKACTNGHFL